MDFDRIFMVFQQLGYFSFEPGETRGEFLWRIFLRSVGPLIAVLATLYQVISGDTGRLANLIASTLSIAYCCFKLVEIFLTYILASTQMNRLVPAEQPPPQQMAVVSRAAESVMEEFSLQQKEFVLRKVLTDPFKGPRERSIVIIRNWFSYEIFKPLMRMIAETEVALANIGFENVQIGTIPLPRLEQLKIINNMLNTYAPKFALLLNFLRISENQQYIVNRYQQFAEGSYVGHFSPYCPDVERTFFPSDSGLVFHSFCVYMDAYLRHHEHHAGRPRPFFEDYVVISLALPNAYRIRSNVVIHCTSWSTPIFTIIQVGADKIDLAYDRSDVFKVLVDFLCIVKYEMNGILSGVNVNSICDSILSK